MKISNEKDYIEFIIDKVYDDDYIGYGKLLRITIKGKSSFIFVEFDTYTAVGYLKKLYNEVKIIYDKCKGKIEKFYFSYDKDIELNIEFLNSGHVKVSTNIISNNALENKCSMCFITDQTYINQFLHELNIELSKIIE